MTVCDRAGRTLLRSEARPGQLREAVELDLAGLDDGPCSLCLDDLLLQDFCLSDAEPGSLLALVCIDTASLSAGAGAEYVLALRSRATRWRYIVMASGAAAGYADYGIEAAWSGRGTGRPAPAFERLDFAGAAACFASLEALPFMERPERALRVNLQARDQASGRTLRFALPGPQARQLVREGGAEPPFSDIYVYL